MRETLQRNKHKIWQYNYYLSRRKRLAESLSMLSDSQARCNKLETVITRLSDNTKEDSDVLALVVHIIEYLAQEKHDPTIASTLESSALSLLLQRKFVPPKSKLSRIFSDLFLAKANALKAKGDLCGCDIYQLLAHYCIPHEVIILAAQPRIEGVPGQLDDVDNSHRPAVINAIRDHRFSGLLFEALALCNESAVDIAVQEEQALINAQLTGNLKEAFDLAQRSQHSGFTNELLMLAKCIKSRQWLDEAVDPEQFSNIYREILQHLTYCYDYHIPLILRLYTHGRFILGHSFADSISELYFTAASTRWLFRSNQYELARVQARRYMALSRIVSQSDHGDALSCMNDVLSRLLDTDDEVISAIEVGPFARNIKGTATLLGQLTWRLGVNRVRQLLTPSRYARRLKSKEVNVITEAMVKHLGRMKGPVMKVGQHLSYHGLSVSREVQNSLDSLLDGSVCLQIDTILETVEAQYGQRHESIFCEFDPQPIGVGSIGQVHRARLHDGAEVAVKVQFPNIQAAIKNDMRLLSMVLPLAKLFARNVDMSALVSEMREQFLDEADYLKEAMWQERFYQLWQSHPIIRIPAVHHALCTPKILVSDYIAAARFDEFVATSSQEEKNHAGKGIFDFAYRSLTREFYQADPNPGNFLFKDSMVYVVDFGCVEQWTPREAKGFYDILHSLVYEDFDELRKLMIEWGITDDVKRFDFEYMYRIMGQSTATLLRSKVPVRFNIDAINNELRDLYSLNNPNLSLYKIRPYEIWANRLFLGIAATLAKLGSELDGFKLFQRLHEEQGL